MSKSSYVELLKLYNGSLLDDGWLTVYEVFNNEEENHYYIHSVLLKRNAQFHKSWEWELTSFDYSEIKWRTEDNKGSVGYPLVIERNIFGFKPNYGEVNQNFLLFHNLISDEQGGYKKILKDYDTEVVVRVKNNKIQIKWLYLNAFLHHYKFNLMIYFSYRWHGDTQQTQEDVSKIYNSEDKRLFYRLYKSRSKNIINLEGKKCLKTNKLPRRNCEKFIVDVDSRGSPIYIEAMDKNIKNNQHVLVYFRKEVLAKYHARSNYFTIGPMYINSNQWFLQLCNNDSNYVSVLFPHLVQQLPLEEQLYWKSYNIEPPESAVTRGEIDTIAYGIPHQPDGADHKFKMVFKRFYLKWKSAYSFDLIKWLYCDDKHCFDQLTLLYHNTQPEFDKNIGYLHKVIIESINIEELKKNVTPDDPRDGSIKILEKYLKEKIKPEEKMLEEHMIFLKNLNDLRIGASHRKSEDPKACYNRAAKKFDIDRRGFQSVFEEILEKSIDFILFLENTCERKV